MASDAYVQPTPELDATLKIRSSDRCKAGSVSISELKGGLKSLPSLLQGSRHVRGGSCQPEYQHIYLQDSSSDELQ